MPRSPLPVVADIHFQYKLALAALDAGVHRLRLNPGNIRKPEHIKLVASGGAVTAASRSASASTPARSTPSCTSSTAARRAEAMVESAKKEIGYFEEVGFDHVEDLGEGVERRR